MFLLEGDNIKREMSRRVGTNALRLTIAQIITMALSMANVMLLSRFRSLEEYGTYSQLLMSSSIVLSVCMLGVPNSFNYFGARAKSKEEQANFIGHYYSIITILSFFSGVVLVVVFPLIQGYFKNSMLQDYAFFVLLNPWITGIMGTIDYYLVYFDRVLLLTKYKIINGILVIGTALACYWMKLSFFSYMIIYTVAESIMTLLIYVIVCAISGKIIISIDLTLVRRILHFSIPLGLSAIIGTISIELDKLLIGRFYNAEEMAIYTNAAKEMPVTIIASSISTVLLPVLMKYINNREYNKGIDLWGNAIKIAYAFMSFFSAILIVFASAIMTFLYSEKYVTGVPVFRIYSLLLLFRCTYFGMMLNVIGKTKSIMYFSLLSLILNILLNIVFYFFIGFYGPAVATLVATSVLALSQLLYTSRSIRISFREIFPWKDIFIISIINVLFAIVFFIVKDIPFLEKLINNYFIRSIFVGCIWLCSYLLLMKKYLTDKWRMLNEG